MTFSLADIEFIVKESHRDGTWMVSKLYLTIRHSAYEEFVGSKIRWNVYYKEGRDETIEYDLIDTDSVTIDINTLHMNSAAHTL